MALKEIFITQADLERIKASMERMDQDNRREQRHLSALEGELSRAIPVQPQDVPADVVTMNSTVRLKDLDTGKDVVYTLVYPEDADVEAARISVLAPIGTALLGYRVGDEIDWKVPSGTRRFRVEAVVFQPEAAGQFHL